MKIRSHAQILASSLALLGACSAGDGQTSLSRSAHPLWTRDARIEVKTKSEGATAADARAKGSVPDDGLVRTSADAYSISFDLKHAWLDKPDLAKDVAKWGALARVTAPNGKKSEITLLGATGSFDLRLGDGDGIYVIQLEPMDFSLKGSTRALGESSSVRVRRDTRAPEVSITAVSSEALATGIGEIEIRLTYRDADTAPPACKALEILSSDQRVVESLAGVSNRSLWQQEKDGKSFGIGTSWKLGNSKPTGARVVCADATGNATTSVASIVDAKESRPRTLISLSAAGASSLLVPRVSSDGSQRLVMHGSRKLVSTFGITAPDGARMSAELTEVFRKRYTLRFEATPVRGGVAGEPVVLWSGAPLDSVELEIPAVLEGEIDIVSTLQDLSVDSSGKARAAESSSLPVFVPLAIATAFTIQQPAKLSDAAKNAPVALAAEAVLDGVPFESGQFPKIETSEEGQTWTPLAGAAFERVSAGGAQPNESWKIVFPYPFDSERPFVVRLKARTIAGVEVVSAPSPRVVGAPDARKPAVGAAARTTCAGKSKLAVWLESRIACVASRDATLAPRTARLLLRLRNEGATPLSLSTEGVLPSQTLAYGLWSGGTRVGSGRLSLSESQLNEGGLDAEHRTSIDVEASLLARSSLELRLDQEEQGGHSLQAGTYCYSAEDNPTIVFAGAGALAPVTAAPFGCATF